MKSFTFKVKYEIGYTLKTDERVYKCIGYNYVKGRGLQYVFLYLIDGTTKWLYVDDFEIEMIIKK